MNMFDIQNNKNFNVMIDQHTLMNTYEVPIATSMGTKFAALEIQSPKDLTTEKIKTVAKLAYDYAYEMYTGFERKGLSKNLKAIKAEEIQFTVYASTHDRGAKNLAFNHPWQR